MLDFNDEIVQFKKNGETHQVKKPSVGQIKEYTKELEKEKDENKQNEILVKHLVKWGLKEGVYEQLTPKQIKIFLQELLDNEKN